jgi:hypothetical protein
MRYRMGQTVLGMALVMAVLAFMTSWAQADTLLFQSGGELAAGSPAEEATFVFDATGETVTAFTDPGIIETQGGTCLGTVCVEWSGLSTSLDWILLVDGGSNEQQGGCPGTTGGIDGKCYSLYQVINGQEFDSNGVQTLDLPAGSGGLSHITYFTAGTTTVPEPSVLLLLGSGLVGTLALARRLM